MKKFYMLAAAAMMVFAANAETEMQYEDLTADMFHHWTAADASAEQTEEAAWCDYVLGESTGMPYGNGNVYYLEYADLSEYDVIVAEATEGEPRFLFNRVEDNGTVNVEFPRDRENYGWETVEAGENCTVYTVDIKAIVDAYGFAHLHAIKGANWANTTVISVKVGKLVEVETPVSINGVSINSNAVIYNILGQRVSAPVRGQIYIVNGRKMTF